MWVGVRNGLLSSPFLENGLREVQPIGKAFRIASQLTGYSWGSSDGDVASSVGDAVPYSNVPAFSSRFSSAPGEGFGSGIGLLDCFEFSV